MTDAKILELVQRICNQTLLDKLKWEITPRKALQARISVFLVLFEQVDDGYTIRILDMNNTELEAIHTSEIRGSAPVFIANAQFVTYYAAVKAAYRHAYRTAVGADKAIDDILRELS